MVNGSRYLARARIPVALLFAIYTPLVVLLGLVIGARLVFDVPTAALVRDPAQTIGFNPLTGVVSQVGVLVWAFAASSTLFAAVQPGVGRIGHRFLLAAGALSALLGLDDLFLLHDVILPTVAGIPDTATYAAYALALVVWLTAFRDHILTRTEPLLLGLALVAFALSMGFDVISEALFANAAGSFLLEDSLKLAGIVTWAAYLSRAAAATLRRGSVAGSG